MDVLKYSGRITIEKILPDGEREKIFSSHNQGTESLARLLLSALCVGESVSDEDKPYRLLIKKSDNSTVFGPYLPVEAPTYMMTGELEGELHLIFYLPPLAVSGGSGNVFLELLNMSKTSGGSDVTLARVDTGSPSYVVADDETHVVNWTLKVSVE